MDEMGDGAMGFVIENVTNEELQILEREGFEWYLEDMNSRDIVVEGDALYYGMALHALRRA